MPYQRFILILFFALLLELCIYKVHKNKCKADSISIKQVDYTKKKKGRRNKRRTKNFHVFVISNQAFGIELILASSS